MGSSKPSARVRFWLLCLACSLLSASDMRAALTHCLNEDYKGLCKTAYDFFPTQATVVAILSTSAPRAHGSNVVPEAAKGVPPATSLQPHRFWPHFPFLSIQTTSNHFPESMIGENSLADNFQACTASCLNAYKPHRMIAATSFFQSRPDAL